MDRQRIQEIRNMLQEATPGPLQYNGGRFIRTSGTVNTCAYPVSMAVATLYESTDFDADGREYKFEGSLRGNGVLFANAHIIITELLTEIEKMTRKPEPNIVREVLEQARSIITADCLKCAYQRATASKPGEVSICSCEKMELLNAIKKAIN